MDTNSTKVEPNFTETAVESSSSHPTMGFVEAKGVFVQQIRRQTGIQILIEALDAAERGKFLLDGLSTSKALLEQQIAHLQTTRDTMIAEARATAEREAQAMTASYERHLAQARGKLETTQQEMQQWQDRITRVVAAHEAQKMEWRAEVDVHAAEMVKCQEEIRLATITLMQIRETMTQDERSHEMRREQWEKEQKEAEASRETVKQEIAGLLARLESRGT